MLLLVFSWLSGGQIAHEKKLTSWVVLAFIPSSCSSPTERLHDDDIRERGSDTAKAAVRLDCLDRNTAVSGIQERIISNPTITLFSKKMMM